mgnify:CR=1 FL=1
MKNVYQNSKILSKGEFKKIEKAFKKAWSRETTFADVYDEWSQENKAFGQCLVTAAIINDLYGGRLIYDKNNKHYWNELPDGSEQDFSRCQFKDERIFSVTKYKTKEEALYDDYGIKRNTAKRYRLLIQKFQEAYKNLTS